MQGSRRTAIFYLVLINSIHVYIFPSVLGVVHEYQIYIYASCKGIRYYIKDILYQQMLVHLPIENIYFYTFTHFFTLSDDTIHTHFQNKNMSII